MTFSLCTLSGCSWRSRSLMFASAVALSGTLLSAQRAHACGGFFCSQTQPVNQAAERIIFASHGDGRTTAIIEIEYEGPAESFSWLLPLPSVPEDEDVAVASGVALDRLQSATNPTYSLTTRVEGECREDERPSALSPASPSQESLCAVNPLLSGCNPQTGAVAAPPSEVSVAASGVVGAFEYAVISVEPELSEPEDAAVNWLEDNGYDVPESSVPLLRPYLAEGMYLLALRLTKGSDTGSIRPLRITYEGSEPSIPIRLTAVAAAEDMGVMTFNLAESRSVPFNYGALELNEARLDWFNSAQNYAEVLNEAADEAGGHGFVTEFAGATDSLANTVWFDFEESEWNRVRTATYSSFGDIFRALFNRYGQLDGFRDAVRSVVQLPEGLSEEDFRLCPECYANEVEFEPTALMDAVEEGVIEPVRGVQELIDELPYMTRLFTTLSAQDMTVDPVFTFNADLPDVSNVHTAERITECDPSVYIWEAPWRIELPQGTVIRGSAEDSTSQWPGFDAQPANFVVRSLAATGQGALLTDNQAEIESELDVYNAERPTVTGSAASAGLAGSEGGCALAGTHARSRGRGAWSWLGLLGLLWLVRAGSRRMAPLRHRTR